MEFLTSIVGVNFRPADAKQAVRDLAVGDEVYLEPEPDNAYDTNAIKVLTADDTFIGYIPRSENFEIGEALAADRSYTAEVTSFASELKPFISLVFED